MTTVHCIEKYLKDGDKILDIGAGAGEYSLYFARKGYEVSALELADANIAAFKKKLTPEDKIDLVQGNALDLSRYADESFDIVLLFGPLYHLKNDADKQKCISGAKRVCKDGGKIFFAFISNDFVFLTEFGYDVNYFSNGDYPELPHRAAQRGRGRRHLDDLPQNGDTLRLRHTVKITRVPVVTLTENDYPMATVDDLNALLDTLAHEADRKAVYILQLPA